MMSAIKKNNLRLVELPGVDDNVFVLATDTLFLWFAIDSGDHPEQMSDDEALEQAGFAIQALLDERKDA